jgi:PAS domain S-box-containing protein
MAPNQRITTSTPPEGVKSFVEDYATNAMRTVRNQLIDQGLVFLACVAPFAFILSLLRILEHGWQSIFFFHCALVVVIISCAVFRKRLSYAIRSGVLLGFFVVTGLSGLLAFGLCGGALLLLTLFAVLTAITYGTRAGLFACAVSLGILGATGFAVVSGRVVFPFDIGAYATSLTAWLLMSILFTMFIPITIIALGTVNAHLVTALQEVQKSQGAHEHLVANLVGTFLYRHNTVGIIEYVSPSISHVLGYSSEEFCVHHSKYLTDHPANKDAQKNTRLCMTGIQPPLYELQIYHKDGSLHWLEISETPVFDEHGTVISVEGVAHDITKRKNAEEKLEEERIFSETVLDSLPGIFYVYDELPKLVRWNKNHETLTGYSADELSRMSPLDFFNDENKELIAESVKEAFETGHVQLECELVRKDGARVFYDFRGHRLDVGRKRFLIGLALDISDRKDVEQRLKLTHFSIEHSQSAMVWLDRHARFQFVNQALCDYVGYDRETLLTMGVNDLDPDWNRERFENEGWKLWKTSTEPDIFESKMQRKDGSIFPIEVAASLVSFEGQELLFALVTDISARKLAEQEANRLRRYLRNIVDSMPSTLIGVDDKGMVTQWNREAAEKTSIPPREAIGQSLATVYPRLARELPAIETAIQSGKTHVRAKVPWYEDESSGFEDITIYPLLHDEDAGAVLRIDDVTERVKMEDILVQSEKMMSVGGLAAGMAHEINNPLSGIMMNAQVILNRFTQDIPANKRAAEKSGTSMEAIRGFMEERNIIAMLEQVVESGTRAAKIVTNMLSFSRKSESRAAPHVMSALLDTTVELIKSDYDLKGKYDFKKIEIIREYEMELPAVSCEATKIQQVFLNLLKNGAQAMADWDQRTAPPRFILRAFVKGNGVQVEVEDNGPGMSEEVCRRIFEPFFTTKPTGVGTGLGMSISYFIITENHRGSMTVESSPGQGARFIIHLPITA